MAKYCDAVIAVWDGKSAGTKHMIAMAEKYHKPCHIHLVVTPKELQATLDEWANTEWASH